MNRTHKENITVGAESPGSHCFFFFDFKCASVAGKMEDNVKHLLTVCMIAVQKTTMLVGVQMLKYK